MSISANFWINLTIKKKSRKRKRKNIWRFWVELSTIIFAEKERFYSVKKKKDRIHLFISFRHSVCSF